MAQYGKISGTVIDAHGNPVSGATVEVRTQGAFVTATQAGPAYSVDDVGGIVASTSHVVANSSSSPNRLVTAVAAGTVTAGALGLGTLNNGDRLSVASPLPTLYSDTAGDDTKANPLQTDASGYWEAWAPVMPYDIKETYGSTIKMKWDVWPEGAESVKSNVFSYSGALAWLRNTVRTLTDGLLFDFQNNGNSKLNLDYAGNLTAAGGITASGDLNISGNAVIPGTLSVTGASTLTGAVSAPGGETVGTSFSYTGTTGNFGLTAGSIETADLAANAVVATRVGTGNTDQALVAGAAFADVANATVTFTPFSSASEIDISAVTPGEGNGAGAFFLHARIVDGTAATIYHESAANQSAAGTANAPMTVMNIARVTGLTGSQTFKVQAKCTTTNVNILSNSTDRKCRIVVREFKK